MTIIQSFYSLNEIDKPENKRVYHFNDSCGPGREILQNERRYGTGGYRKCKDCEQLS